MVTNQSKNTTQPIQTKKSQTQNLYLISLLPSIFYLLPFSDLAFSNQTSLSLSLRSDLHRRDRWLHWSKSNQYREGHTDLQDSKIFFNRKCFWVFFFWFFFFFNLWVCILGSGFMFLLFLFKTPLDLNSYDF